MEHGEKGLKQKSLYMHAYMHIFMTKVISLSDDAYENLKAAKKEGESFSKVVNRIAPSAKKKDIMDFWGKWPGGKEELDKLEKDIYESRKKFKLRKVDF
jgi:predicted CopG family antitoxin